MTLVSDPKAIAEALRIFMEPGQVVEIRAPKVRSGRFSNVHFGYFGYDQLNELVRDVQKIKTADAIYFMLNPIRHSLHARAYGRIKEFEKGDNTTGDKEIISRTWLMIDLDAKRDAGISATDEEKAASLESADKVAAHLQGLGFPEPVRTDSGNGYHLYYRIDLPAEDDLLVHRCLEALAKLFNDEKVKVDLTVSNAARITKLPGTPVRKGDHTPDRPHRMARLLSAPDAIQHVPTDLLEALAGAKDEGSKGGEAPKKSSTAASKPPADHFDVAAYLVKMGKDQDVEGPDDYNGGKRWTFKVCPWRESDGPGCATIIQFESGAITAGCSHHTCPGSRAGMVNHWLDLRALWGDTPPADYSKVIARLAALHPVDYEKVRKEEAEQLQCRATELDKLVFAARPHKAGTGENSGKGPLCSDIEAWPEPVNAESLLDELLATIKRFIVCNEETAIAAVLWAVFTWFIDHVQVAPLLVITAPEPRCGKTQALDFIGRLACRPLVASNISPAAVFRVIEAHKPTLMIDEADSFLKENEELRGVINSGHTRQSAYVVRVVGDDHEPQSFSTWGAKALSGIGHLQGTLMDRAVILELRRKLKSEHVQRLRHADPKLFSRLASMLARLAEDAGQSIQRSRPVLPDEMNDRAQDNWEPLLAIADYAGGEWPKRARNAALRLAGVEKDSMSISTQLLADIRELFDPGLDEDKQPKKRSDDHVGSANLLKRLASDDLKPWATFDHGRTMTPRQLSRQLKGYGLKPKDIKQNGATIKGYTWKELDEVFDRYLEGENNPLPATSEQGRGSTGCGSVAVADKRGNLPVSELVAVADGCATGNGRATSEAAPLLDGCGVADKSGDALGRVAGADWDDSLPYEV